MYIYIPTELLFWIPTLLVGPAVSAFSSETSCTAHNTYGDAPFGHNDPSAAALLSRKGKKGEGGSSLNLIFFFFCFISIFSFPYSLLEEEEGRRRSALTNAKF